MSNRPARIVAVAQTTCGCCMHFLKKTEPLKEGFGQTSKCALCKSLMNMVCYNNGGAVCFCKTNCLSCHAGFSIKDPKQLDADLQKIRQCKQCIDLQIRVGNEAFHNAVDEDSTIEIETTAKKSLETVNESSIQKPNGDVNLQISEVTPTSEEISKVHPTSGQVSEVAPVSVDTLSPAINNDGSGELAAFDKPEKLDKDKQQHNVNERLGLIEVFTSDVDEDEEDLDTLTESVAEKLKEELCKDKFEDFNILMHRIFGTPEKDTGRLNRSKILVFTKVEENLKTKVPNHIMEQSFVLAMQKIFVDGFFNTEGESVLNWKHLIAAWRFGASSRFLTPLRDGYMRTSSEPLVPLLSTANNPPITLDETPNTPCCCGCENFPLNNNFVCFASKRNVFDFTCLQGINQVGSNTAWSCKLCASLVDDKFMTDLFVSKEMIVDYHGQTYYRFGKSKKLWISTEETYYHFYRHSSFHVMGIPKNNAAGGRPALTLKTLTPYYSKDEMSFIVIMVLLKSKCTGPFYSGIVWSSLLQKTFWTGFHKINSIQELVTISYPIMTHSSSGIAKELEIATASFHKWLNEKVSGEEVDDMSESSLRWYPGLLRSNAENNFPKFCPYNMSETGNKMEFSHFKMKIYDPVEFVHPECLKGLKRYSPVFEWTISDTAASECAYNLAKATGNKGEVKDMTPLAQDILVPVLPKKGKLPKDNKDTSAPKMLVKTTAVITPRGNKKLPKLPDAEGIVTNKRQSRTDATALTEKFEENAMVVTKVSVQTPDIISKLNEQMIELANQAKATAAFNAKLLKAVEDSNKRADDLEAQLKKSMQQQAAIASQNIKTKDSAILSEKHKPKFKKSVAPPKTNEEDDDEEEVGEDDKEDAVTDKKVKKRRMENKKSGKNKCNISDAVEEDTSDDDEDEDECVKQIVKKKRYRNKRKFRTVTNLFNKSLRAGQLANTENRINETLHASQMAQVTFTHASTLAQLVHASGIERRALLARI